MANQKTLAIAFALMVSSANADNCMTGIGGTYKMKASLTALTCSSDLASVEACGAACCDAVPNICETLESSGSTCAATHYNDDSKKAVAATTANYATNCCTVKKMCDITCSAGMKNKAAYATTKCGGSTCTTSECCDVDATTCMGLMGNSCDAGNYMDSSKYGVAATAATYKTACCTAKKMCDITCSAGMTNKAAYATTKCASSTCSNGECCDLVPNTCMNHAVAAGKGCAANQFSSMSATAVKADSSDYKTLCCTAKATCEAFGAAKLAASGAVKQQAPAIAILMSVGGYLLFGK